MISVAPAVSHSAQPRLAITAGDPAGIGMEVLLKALAADSLACPDLAAITVVGNRALLRQTYEHLTQQTGLNHALADPEELTILDVPLPAAVQSQIHMGNGNAASGAASFQFLETAIRQTLAGEFDAVVTAPIAKSAWKAAGHPYPAHVPVALTPALMTLKLELLIDSLHQDFGLTQPRIAIAGLNPHSGEQGQLGEEEQTWLIPWLEQSRARFPAVQLQGPVPPDTLWVQPGRAWFDQRVKKGMDSAALSAYDAYLALYHDQGLIPVKLMAFDRAVNTTIGLPFVRTSPDHGTAFDIAGRGIAQADSFKAAIEWAIELVKQRQHRLVESQRLI
jgi:4-hydroxythreonine-4-phosphate dehydrogenase